MSTTADYFSKARLFMYAHARLLERHLFDYWFEDGSKELVANAVKAYQNPDGGFGHGLEPDKRTASSQPIDVEFAFHVLDDVQTMDHPMVYRACDFLESISTPEGGVPFSLPTVNAYPHAPWWSASEDPPASLNPTASIAAMLLKHGIEHPWRDRAVQYCSREVEKSTTLEFHDLMPIISFLRYVPEREAATAELERIGKRIQSNGLIEVDPDADGYVKLPLDWAPTPDSYCRRLISDDLLATHLSALVRSQRADGGWSISWHAISPTVELEWRGIVTLQVLRSLEAYGNDSTLGRTE